MDINKEHFRAFRAWLLFILFLPDVDSALYSDHEAGTPTLSLGGPELPQLLLPAPQHQAARAAGGAHLIRRII